jgi:hypothetical protein
MLGEALDLAVRVFRGTASRYRSYTRSRCDWQCNGKMWYQHYRFWGPDTEIRILYFLLLNDAVSIGDYNRCDCPFQWLRGLWRGSAVARLLGLRVRIPPGARSCECCVLSGRGFCSRADHSSRRVLPSVVCLSVIVNPRQWGGPGTLGGGGGGCCALVKKKGGYLLLP